MFGLSAFNTFFFLFLICTRCYDDSEQVIRIQFSIFQRQDKLLTRWYQPFDSKLTSLYSFFKKMFAAIFWQNLPYNPMRHPAPIGPLHLTFRFMNFYLRESETHWTIYFLHTSSKKPEIALFYLILPLMYYSIPPFSQTRKCLTFDDHLQPIILRPVAATPCANNVIAYRLDQKIGLPIVHS